MAAGNWISMTWNGEVQIWLFINFHLFFSLKSTSSFVDSSASFKPVINTPSLQDDRYLVCSRATSGFTLPFHKGRYTRGILLPEHTPGSFCTCQYTRGSVFKFAQFAPGACSQIFNRLNIVEHFAGWKFCSRGWSIPMKSLVHTEELCSQSVPLQHAPGAKSLLCIRLNTRVADRGGNRTWQRSQVGSRKLEVGSWKWEVGSWKSEVGNRKSEVRSGWWEVGSRRSEV